MPKLDAARRRDAQRAKARHTIRTSRAFLHTLDRLSAERDRDRLARQARRIKALA